MMSSACRSRSEMPRGSQGSGGAGEGAVEAGLRVVRGGGGFNGGGGKTGGLLLGDGAVGGVRALDVEQVSTLGQVHRGRHRPLAGLLHDVPLSQPDGGVLVAVERWPTHGGGLES